jgi:hypothetical protein
MYGQTHHFDLTLISPDRQPIIVPTHATPTPEGIEFRFTSKQNPHVSGSLTVRTDAGEVTEIEIGGPDIKDMLDVGHWALPHLRIEPGSLNTPAITGIDDEALDTLRGLIYSAIGYARGHAARIKAHLPPPADAIGR